MARSRNIKPGFFKNEDLAECTLAARLCFAGLWTLADREGRLEDRPKRIKGELFPFDTFDVEPLLIELAGRGFIVRYEVDGARCIQISRFSVHQTPHYTEKPSVIKPPELQESPRQSRGDDSRSGASIKTEGLQEHSRSTPGKPPPLRGGQNPLIPDSLIPDSLIPDSPKNTSGAGAPGAAPPQKPPNHDPKPLTAKDRVWLLGPPLLGEKGRGLLGKLAKAHGDEVLADVLAEATLDPPLEPKAWVTAACEARAKAHPQRPNGTHYEAVDMLSDPTPDWAIRAGFTNRFEAENAGCLKGNAAKFQNGQRIAQ